MNPAACGTYSGAQAHKRRGEKNCPACAAAQSDYMRSFRRRTRRTSRTYVDIDDLEQAAACARVAGCAALAARLTEAAS